MLRHSGTLAYLVEVEMAGKSTAARQAEFWLVVGLAVLCLILALIVVQRRNNESIPSQPIAAATATPQAQSSTTQVSTQTGAPAGTTNQGPLAGSGTVVQSAPGYTPVALQPITPVALQPLTPVALQSTSPAAVTVPGATATLRSVDADP